MSVCVSDELWVWEGVCVCDPVPVALGDCVCVREAVPELLGVAVTDAVCVTLFVWLTLGVPEELRVSVTDEVCVRDGV